MIVAGLKAHGQDTTSRKLPLIAIRLIGEATNTGFTFDYLPVYEDKDSTYFVVRQTTEGFWRKQYVLIQ